MRKRSVWRLVGAILIAAAMVVGIIAVTPLIPEVNTGAISFYEIPTEVWVDDDFNPGTPGWGVTHFDKIQDGIDAVSSSMVYVAAGTYYENITMKTGITLQGAGTSLTSIVGDKVDCRNITDFVIERFTIDGGIDCPGDTGHVSGIIRNNIITSDGWGIGATWDVDLEIVNNLIINNRNTENTDGAGIAVMYNDAYARIINNTIVGNYHGIWAYISNVEVQSNIIAFNSSGEGGPTSTGIDHHGNIGSIQISYNDVYGNDINYGENASPGIGDISGDPLFLDPTSGDYHLQSGSPCIDAGTNTGAPIEDIERNPRPIDGDGDGDAVTDIGAYEREAISEISIQAYIDGRSQLIVTGNNTVQWHHLDWAAPGRLEGADEPTIINGIDWFPVWPDIPDAENRQECYSSINEDIDLALPEIDMVVVLNIIQARNSISIVQYPSAGNNYTLIFEFDDNPQGGAAWYECELMVTW